MSRAGCVCTCRASNCAARVARLDYIRVWATACVLLRQAPRLRTGRGYKIAQQCCMRETGHRASIAKYGRQYEDFRHFPSLCTTSGASAVWCVRPLASVDGHSRSRALRVLSVVTHGPEPSSTDVPLPSVDVYGLVSGAPQPPDLERRREYRRALCDLPTVATEFTSEGHIGSCWECRVIEVSDGGCRMLSPRLTPVDSRLLIQIFGSERRPRTCTFAVVRHIKAYMRGPFHLVGVAFQSIPDSAVVRQWFRARQALP